MSSLLVLFYHFKEAAILSSFIQFQEMDKNQRKFLTDWGLLSVHITVVSLSQGSHMQRNPEDKHTPCFLQNLVKWIVRPVRISQ